jgi:hypothetical protein
MSERTLEELLCCGDVLVEVGFGLGGNLEARTGSTVMGYAYLGGEISVELHEDVVEDTEDGRIYARPEAWAKLLREMRDMLACCMILGRMEVVGSEGFILQTDEKDRESIQEAKKLLGEGFINITLDTAITALEERHECEERVRRGLQKIIRLMGEEGLRHGLNKVERAKMTVSEAFGPREENKGEDQVPLWTGRGFWRRSPGL